MTLIVTNTVTDHEVRNIEFRNQTLCMYSAFSNLVLFRKFNSSSLVESTCLILFNYDA